MLSSFVLLEKWPYIPHLEFLNFIGSMLLLMLLTEGAMSPCTWRIVDVSDSSEGTLSWVCMCLLGSMSWSCIGFKARCINGRLALLVSFIPIELQMGWAWKGKHFSSNRWRGAWQIKTYVCSYRLRGSCQEWVAGRTLPCPTYSRWTLPESRWFSGVHLESRCFFFGWEHSQIGMHNPPGFHQDSRWTPDEPHRVSGVHLPDSSVDSTWTQSRVNPPGVQEESV